MTNTQLSADNTDTLTTIVSGIPFLTLVVRDGHLLDDSKQVLSQVFPDWTSEDILLKQCKDGITNKQLTNMAYLASQNMCPPLHARFQNGLVYGFIPGTVAKPEEMGNDLWAPLIAKQLADWHKVDLPGDHTPGLFTLFRNWLNDIPATYEDKRANDIYQNHFTLDMLHNELNEMQPLLVNVKSPVVFAHNDLLSGNIIISESKDKVSFIDYEYAMYNYRGFDIANHFNEYAGFECDYSRYPDKAAQLRWFKVYLDHANLDSSSEALEKMHKEVSVFQLASHYYWGVWALVQASISDIDFDYMDYARLRFEEYFKNKSQLLD
ncbi:hypothetical protein H4S08_001002 [Coemansia sp. RSA 1365]|nr:hypothetical protein H4S08_001002 [Coemansia sp. RSA 1365]